MRSVEWQNIYNMSFNQKAIYTSFFILVLVFGYGSWYYKKTHPKYIPIPPREEVTLTIIPGWNLRQIAEYIVKMGFASSTDDVYKFTGEPGRDYRTVASTFPKLVDGLEILKEKPDHVSYEGYLAPETYRVFRDASVLDILKKLINQRDQEVDSEIWADIKKSRGPLYEVLTIASLLEKEVQTAPDKARVADIIERRLARNWALQFDSTVHYAVSRSGDVFTTSQERALDSPWNTYKYPGLPLGPIATPSADSIKAVLYPEKNDYWYFLTGKDGTVYYGRTLEEHNANKRHL